MIDFDQEQMKNALLGKRNLAVPELELPVLLVIFAAIGVGSLVKGMTGFGLPLIAVPFMAPFIGLDHALAVMVLPSLLSNVWIMTAQRAHNPGWARFIPLMAASLLTIGLGTWVLVRVPERFLLMFMAFWLLAYLVWHFFRRGKDLSLKSQKVLGPIIGVMAGFTQGTTGITTPFVVTYLHALKLKPQAYVYANAIVYQVFWIVHGAFLWWFGLFDLGRLWEGVLALIPMAIFLPIGIHFTGRLKHSLFDRIIIVLMVVLSAWLFYSAVR